MKLHLEHGTRVALLGDMTQPRLTLPALSLVLAAVAPALACDNESLVTTRAYALTESELPYRIADAPDGDIDGLRFEVESVQVHHLDDGWIELRDPELRTVDVTQMPLELGFEDLPTGEYDQLRFVLNDAWLLMDGRTVALDVPSGEQSGYKIHGYFCLDGEEAENEDGQPEAELWLAFDFEKGIKYSDQRGYWLVPSVQILDAPTCPGA